MKAMQASRLRAQYTPMRKMGTKKQRLRRGETSRRGTSRGSTAAGSRIFCSSPVGRWKMSGPALNTVMMKGMYQ